MELRPESTTPPPSPGARRLITTVVSVALGLLMTICGPAPGHADDVHLTNGNTFEDVIARIDGDQVRIRLPEGELSLPLSRVLRIDKEDSALAEYLSRKQALYSDPEATGTDWLELARWAQARNLAHSARESALRAARLDPALPGLNSLLSPHGYVLDEEVGRWIPYAEAMHRRGYVEYRGEWVPREEVEARLAALREEQARRRARRAEQAAQRALDQAIEARIQAEVAKEVARRNPGVVYGPSAVVGSFVPFFGIGHGHGHGHGHARGPALSPEAQRNEFRPPAGQAIEQRQFGGSLSPRLPNGFGGAPGRLHHVD